jgi:hypothetical protein
MSKCVTLVFPGSEREMLHISYSAIERALAAAYRIPDGVREGPFRAAITNLQKLGLFREAARPGRGVPIHYTPDEWHRLMVAFEMCEAGVPPTTAVGLIKAFWEEIKTIVALAEKSYEREESPENDVILVLAGVSLRSGAWTAPKGATFPGVPNFNHTRLKNVGRDAERWLRKEHDIPATLPARVVMMNLSARLRLFHPVLAALSIAEPNVLELEPAARSKRKRKRN